MTRKKMKDPTDDCCWVDKLFALMFECSDELHVPSENLENYRNKITYGLPLPEPLSPLAQQRINAVCQTVAQWNNAWDMLREVMVKATRDGGLLVRVTVQLIISPDRSQSDDWKEAFVKHMLSIHPAIKCICYNVAVSKARPIPKEHPVHLLYGPHPYVMETTPNGLQYQIGPDTFSEVNHEVERLQYDQAVVWLQEFAGKEPILLVSGRDVSSFGLGFGSLDYGHRNGGRKIFSRVLAVQHCPLVHADCVANFHRHRKQVANATVMHRSKIDMVDAIKEYMEPRQHHAVVCVLTGGRKGLVPSYVEYLLESKNVRCIIYNSCSTKSLVRDMKHFMRGFMIDDFKSYDFLPGTGYTASLTRLVRRPRTLILPIGPAGIGKSSLAKRLVNRLPSIQWWERDAVFHCLREKGLGLNKARQLVHANLLEFLRQQDKEAAMIVDSTNGNADARKLYMAEARPDRTACIALKPPTGQKERVLELLMKQTRNRLGDNESNHPSFPNTVEEQRRKHIKILEGIEYPLSSAMQNNDDESHIAGEVVVLSCDPLSEEMDALLFEVLLELSAGDHLRRTIRSKLLKTK